MESLVMSITLAMNHFVVYAALFTVPFLLLQVVRKKLNFVRLGVNYAFLLYVLCVIGLVFFPLLSMNGAVTSAAHGIQMIPFQFVRDIIRETPFVWNQPQTYRLGDVDDLIANTLGGLIGYGIMRFLEKRVTVVGKVENFDIEMGVRDKAVL